MAHNNGVFRKCREVHYSFAEKICQKTGLYIGNIGGALTEELIFHAQKHGVVRIIGITDCLLSARTSINGTVDHIFNALVFGKLDMRSHDCCGIFTNSFSHTFHLSVCLIDEFCNSVRVALLFCRNIINRVRCKGKIWRNCYLGITNSNAV